MNDTSFLEEPPKTEGSIDNQPKSKCAYDRRQFRARKNSLIPKPSPGPYRQRSEQYCISQTLSNDNESHSLFICATTTPVDIGTTTSSDFLLVSKAIQMSSLQKDSECNTFGLFHDKDYTKWMKQMQFPETLQALFLSEKGLRKFQTIIQDQINVLSSGRPKTIHPDYRRLPPISHYQIIENKAKSDTDFLKANKTGTTATCEIINRASLFGTEKEVAVTNPETSHSMAHTATSKHSAKGLLQIDEIKKDLITVCAYIFKQTRIINELWKYLENNTGSKHQLNRENIKNITAGALNQHLNKLHSIRENLFRFNEKYRADLDKRIHLLKQITNYYNAEGESFKIHK